MHVLAAVTWIGGMAFLVLVVVPLLRRPEHRERAAELVLRSGERFRTIGWICLSVLIGTGATNMWFRGLRWADFFNGRFHENPMARALAWKLSLVASTLVVSAVHDFFVGPRATRAWLAAPASVDARRGRRLAATLGRLNAVLALTIVFIAVMLARGGF